MEDYIHDIIKQSKYNTVCTLLLVFWEHLETEYDTAGNSIQFYSIWPFPVLNPNPFSVMRHPIVDDTYDWWSQVNVRLSFIIQITLLVCLSTCLFFCLFICSFVYLSVCLFVFLCRSLSVSLGGPSWKLLIHSDQYLCSEVRNMSWKKITRFTQRSVQIKIDRLRYRYRSMTIYLMMDRAEQRDENIADSILSHSQVIVEAPLWSNPI